MHRSSATLIIKEGQKPLDKVISSINGIILGKEPVIRLAIACMLAKGHLLLEDLPGVGKTTMAHVLARSLGLDFNRIQFTSDMLPADILGVSVYDQKKAGFRFHPGPIFSQVVLADEINRATPKAQSALLEAMEEYQVTTEGETHPLPDPFFVIATQNPSNQIGTFPLPESQLDRFLMRLGIGYPDSDAERALLKGCDRRDLLRELAPAMQAVELRTLQAEVSKVHVSDTLIDYIQALLAHTRESPLYRHGLSPRAGLALLRCSQAWAMLEGRHHVLPEDVQAVLPSVVNHRLQPSPENSAQSSDDLVSSLLNTVPVS